LRERMPPQVIAHLELGANGQLDETAKGGDSCFEKTRNVIVGALGLALAAALLLIG